MSETRAKALGLQARAYIRAMAMVGYEPSIMGYGPVPASKLTLKKAGLSVSDIALFARNKAFAAQMPPCIRGPGRLEVLDEKVNLNSATITLGIHWVALESVISTTLLNLPGQHDAQFEPGNYVHWFGSEDRDNL